jgi:TRAP-type mannitol/chloroaromatic compound transport system permease large subunit
MSNAYQEAQRSFGLETTGVVSVGDLFAGALLPGLILVALYAIYISITAYLKPAMAPAQDWPEGVSPWMFIRKTMVAMLPPILLIIAVLGSILSGYATPTRGAALGALGAILLAAYRTAPTAIGRRAALFAAIGLMLLVVVDLTGVDMRFEQSNWTGIERIAVSFALLLAGLAIIGTSLSILPLIKNKQLGDVSRTTMHITSMVFVILIGATVFTLIFRGFGGDELVGRLLEAAPGGKWGALALVMVVMFILGFFLDFIEITFVVVPLVAPPLLATGMDPIWLGVLMALNLQTSFLTPPFGFALFYLRGVAPPEVTTTALYRGVLPFIAIQIFVILLVILMPGIATKLPAIMLN